MSLIALTGLSVKSGRLPCATSTMALVIVPIKNLYDLTAQRIAARLKIIHFNWRNPNEAFASDRDIPIAKSIRAAERAVNTWYDKANLAA
jgi:hypothetical protein